MHDALRKCARKANRNVAWAAAKVDYVSCNGIAGKGLPEESDEIGMGLRKIRVCVCVRLGGVLHQLGFGDSVHWTGILLEEWAGWEEEGIVWRWTELVVWWGENEISLQETSCLEYTVRRNYSSLCRFDARRAFPFLSR